MSLHMILFITFVVKIRTDQMFRIKRLYTFIYQTFLPIFAMTFGICLFIFIIQFLWQHIDKLVGKGLETSVIVEFFAYASLMLVPQALPLAILLASLMTFGNMGERMELVAIKASGVSLMKIMKPMIVLISLIAVSSFVFQNNINPRVQVKVYSLLHSIRQKSPELNIPEGSFYNELPGYSIYVKDKNLETHFLHDVIIYDTSSGGFKNMSVDVCDSAIISAEKKGYLTLTMFHGERFSNLKEESGRRTSSGGSGEFVPFLRERYDRKEVVIPFEDDLVRIDESRYDQTQISKNLIQLDLAVDSMKLKLDSLNQIDRKTVGNQSFMQNRIKPIVVADSLQSKETTNIPIEANIKGIDIDSVYNNYALHIQSEIINLASSDAKNNSSSQLALFHIEMPKPNLQKNIRMHQIFWHRMFALSFACLIFFFIGAPLGAIIRKGGLGVPVIVSVVLFIIYYIIGNVGYKMARDGLWPAWQGEWLSAAILFPLGVFLTYKSMNESALFNVELYGRHFRRLLKVKSDTNRNATREPLLNEIQPIENLNVTEEQIASFRNFDNNTLKDIVHNYVAYGFDTLEQQLALAILKERDTYFFDVRVNNYDFDYSKRLISYFRENSLYICVPLYLLLIVALVLKLIFKIPVFMPIAILAGIAYLIFYTKSIIYVSDFYKSINKEQKASKVFVQKLLSFLLYPFFHFRFLKKMNNELDKIKSEGFF